MSFSAKAAVLHKACEKMEIQPIEIEAPRADEVLVEIEACGICHTDLVMLGGYWPAPLPAVFGHEGAGRVVSVGPDVTGLQPGDPVILSYASCGSCPSCDSAKPAYCHEFIPRNFGVARPDGSSAFSSEDGHRVSSHFFGQSSFATHTVAPQRNIVKVPDDIPLEILAPLGCGIQTGAGSILNSFNVQAGSTVLIIGAGAVGISAAMAAKIAGAQSIIAMDLLESRLTLAQELGATHTLLSDGRPVPELLASIGITGVDYILDTAGVPSIINEAVTTLNIRGVLGLSAGYPPEEVMKVDFTFMMFGGRRIQGIIEGDASPQDFIPTLISYYRQGLFPFDRLIEHFAFADINEAVAACQSGRVIKPVLRM